MLPAATSGASRSPASLRLSRLNCSPWGSFDVFSPAGFFCKTVFVDENRIKLLDFAPQSETVGFGALCLGFVSRLRWEE